jgi:hypothetical protein
MVGSAAGPLEQPTSAINTNISPPASASERIGALLLFLITIVCISTDMIAPNRASPRSRGARETKAPPSHNQIVRIHAPSIPWRR